MENTIDFVIKVGLWLRLDMCFVFADQNPDEPGLLTYLHVSAHTCAWPRQQALLVKTFFHVSS